MAAPPPIALQLDELVDPVNTFDALVDQREANDRDGQGNPLSA